MRLAELSKGIGFLANETAGDVEVTHITHDSRKAHSGSVFVAIEGAVLDGHKYIGWASQLGAVAVVTDKPEKVNCRLPVIVVEKPREAMARLARRLYNAPDKRIKVIGVTGTNGKTTTTYLVSQLLTPLAKTGRLGTLTYYNGISEERSLRTTPEATDIYRMLGEMENNDCVYAAIEISSHGLKLDRVLDLELHYALFTNLTQDHLDFHFDMESYFLAKQIQFRHLVPGGVAVINWDDPYGRRIEIPEQTSLISYGVHADADLRFEIKKIDFTGADFVLFYKGIRQAFHIPLMGGHNVYNFVAAIAVALSEGRELDELVVAATNLHSVPGRTETLDLGQEFGVIVDFAHTPDALKNVLLACKAVAEGRLITVFGAGGDKDHTKRPEMGAAVEAHSEVIILTTDNPRTEDPDAIMDMVQSGMKRRIGGDFTRDWDRKRAIKTALYLAKPGDMVLIAGRGHEAYQEINGVQHPFDDREVATHYIRERMGRH